MREKRSENNLNLNFNSIAFYHFYIISLFPFHFWLRPLSPLFRSLARDVIKKS